VTKWGGQGRENKAVKEKLGMLEEEQGRENKAVKENLDMLEEEQGSEREP
jgi:hypothetical protein